MYFYKPSKVNVKNKKNEADYGEFSPKKFRSLKMFGGIMNRFDKEYFHHKKKII